MPRGKRSSPKILHKKRGLHPRRRLAAPKARRSFPSSSKLTNGTTDWKDSAADPNPSPCSTEILTSASLLHTPRVSFRPFTGACSPRAGRGAAKQRSPLAGGGEPAEEGHVPEEAEAPVMTNDPTVIWRKARYVVRERRLARRMVRASVSSMNGQMSVCPDSVTHPHSEEQRMSTGLLLRNAWRRGRRKRGP